MHIIHWSLAGLALAACVGTAAFGGTEAAQDAAAVERVELASEIRTGLATQREAWSAKKESLDAVDTTSFGGACKDKKAFASSEVQSAYQQIRDDVLKEFQAPEAAAAKAFIEDQFPKPPIPLKSKCFGVMSVYSEKQVNDFEAKVSEWIKMAEKFSILVDVSVKSTPDRAEAKLRPADGTKMYGPMWTDCKFPKMFRGTYRLVVAKDGYKSFDGEIGMAESDAPQIDCELAKTTDAGSSRCALK